MNEVMKEKQLQKIAVILETDETDKNLVLVGEKIRQMKQEFLSRNQWDKKAPVQPAGSVKEIDSAYQHRLSKYMDFGSLLYQVAILMTIFVCLMGILYLWKGFLNNAEDPKEFMGIFLVLLKVMAQGVGILLTPVSVIVWIAAMIHAAKEPEVVQIAKNDWRRKRNDYQGKVRQYRMELARYKHDKCLFEQYVNNVIGYLDGMIRRMDNLHETTKAHLQKLYEECGIYPKYRNKDDLLLIAHYLLSGICTDLGGPYGAYSRLEWEKKLNTIIVQHDMIYAELKTHTSLLKGLNNKAIDLNEEIKDVHHKLEIFREQYEKNRMGGEKIERS